ncbi:GDSL-like Lipase/Acylhydrolase family protein, partial [Lyngbya aestuarii BL J]
GDSLNVSMVDGTNTKGEVSINNDGTISYNPNGQFDALEANETATDSFSYTINDGQGGTDTATVNLTINGVSATTQPPDNNSNSVRIEAENATTLTNYTIQQPLGDFASGDQFIRLSELTGEAEFVLDNLESGKYEVKVGFYDENDGEAQLSVKLGDTVLDTWTLDQDLGASQPNATSFVERTVSTDLNITAGDQLSINGTANLGELAAIDYLEFTPVEALPEPEPTPGQSQSYANAEQGIFANLEEGVGFVPDKALDKPLKIMPLGDSITQGVDGKDGKPGVTPIAEQGGYRTLLFNKLQNLGVDVDFVGSKSNGPAELGDTDNQGHPGWNTVQLRLGSDRGGFTKETSGVRVWLPENPADVVLLMAGTNDTSSSKDNSAKIYDNARKLVDEINDLTDNDPSYNNGEGAKLILATIPPINSDRQTSIRADNAQQFNQLIRENVVGHPSYNPDDDLSDLEVDGLVDIESILTLDDLADPATTGDNGLHPSQAGYDKMAKAWFEGLLDSQGSRDDLSQINDLIGSNFDDVLAGNAANNRIQGGNGNDKLTGKGGGDTFVYQQPTEGSDIITDFDATEGDQFEVSASGFGGGLTVGTLASDQFVLGTLATDSNDRFLYDTASGNLFFDVDGIGSQTSTLLATLDGNPTLSANEFSIVA